MLSSSVHVTVRLPGIDYLPIQKLNAIVFINFKFYSDWRPQTYDSVFVVARDGKGDLKSVRNSPNLNTDVGLYKTIVTMFQ